MERLTTEDGNYCRDICGQAGTCKRANTENMCKDALRYGRLAEYENSEYPPKIVSQFVSIEHSWSIINALDDTTLRMAYEFQQSKYDREDIENELDMNYDEYCEKFAIDSQPVTEDEIKCMAAALRHLLNNDADACWSVCCQQAVKDVLKKRNEVATSESECI